MAGEVGAIGPAFPGLYKGGWEGSLRGGRGSHCSPGPPLKFTYNALERMAVPLFSLITAWAAAMRAMGMRMGEQDT